MLEESANTIPMYINRGGPTITHHQRSLCLFLAHLQRYSRRTPLVGNERLAQGRGRAFRWLLVVDEIGQLLAEPSQDAALRGVDGADG